MITEIEMPSVEEREYSIQCALDVAIPAKRTLLGEIRRLVHTVGFRFAFRGVSDAVVAALLVSLAIGMAVPAFVVSQKVGGGGYAGAAYTFMPILFFAPLLYFSLLGFTYLKEWMTGTWQILMVCRYNLKYVSALRMILISIAGVLFVPIITLPTAGMEEYVRLVALAFCAMFLYGAMTLLALLASRSLVAWLVVPIVWLFGWGAGLVFASPARVERALSDIPPMIGIVAAVLIFLLYLVEMRLYILRRTQPA